MKKQEKSLVKKFINPLTDFGFKKIFGSEPNKDLLIDFLNGIFQGREHIVDLVYEQDEHLHETEIEAGIVTHLSCIGSDGVRYIIDVQQGNLCKFMVMSFVRTNELVIEQALRERSEGVEKVYQIAILLDHPLDDHATDDRFLHQYCLKDRENEEIIYDGVQQLFVEMVNFVKSESELRTDLDRWLYVLKNMGNLDQIPKSLQQPIFEKLLATGEYNRMTQEEKIRYEMDLKQYRKSQTQNA